MPLSRPNISPHDLVDRSVGMPCGNKARAPQGTLIQLILDMTLPNVDTGSFDIFPLRAKRRVLRIGDGVR